MGENKGFFLLWAMARKVSLAWAYRAVEQWAISACAAAYWGAVRVTARCKAAHSAATHDSPGGVGGGVAAPVVVAVAVRAVVAAS